MEMRALRYGNILMFTSTYLNLIKSAQTLILWPSKFGLVIAVTELAFFHEQTARIVTVKTGELSTYTPRPKED